MNRIMELHTAATNLIVLAQAEERTIAQISQGEGDQYDKDILLYQSQHLMENVTDYLKEKNHGNFGKNN